MTKKIKEISTGDYYSKAHKGKISAASKMMFADPAKPETQKAMRDFKNRDAGMKRVSARNQKASQAQAEKNRQGALAADKENLPALMAQFQKLRGQYDPNFEYSDDHSFWSKQKDIQQQLSALQKRINDAGGKISEGGYTQAHADRDRAWREKEKADKHAKSLAGQFSTPFLPKGDRIMDAKGNLIATASSTENTPEICVALNKYMSKGYKVSEGTNPEYDDEAGMSDNNLETLRRTIDGIDGLIKPGDNLPEWCQEKIAVAKSMLVAVWDYMQSEQERGAMEGQTNEWKKSTKAPMRPKNPVAKAHQAIGTGSGSHKDKKKELPRKAKHKKQAELAETATYDRRLNVLLEAKVLTSQIRDYRKK